MLNQKRSRRESSRQPEGKLPVEPAQLAADLCSPEDAARAKAVRSLCPCRAGWETFESHLDLVDRMKKDPSRLVQAQALHLYEDAREMQSEGYPTSKAQVRNDMLLTRQQSRFRVDAGDLAEVTARDERRHRRRGHAGL